jgi:hypothetical protein
MLTTITIGAQPVGKFDTFLRWLLESKGWRRVRGFFGSMRAWETPATAGPSRGSLGFPLLSSLVARGGVAQVARATVS